MLRNKRDKQQHPTKWTVSLPAENNGKGAALSCFVFWWVMGGAPANGSAEKRKQQEKRAADCLFISFFMDGIGMVMTMESNKEMKPTEWLVCELSDEIVARAAVQIKLRLWWMERTTMESINAAPSSPNVSAAREQTTQLFFSWLGVESQRKERVGLLFFSLRPFRNKKEKWFFFCLLHSYFL